MRYPLHVGLLLAGTGFGLVAYAPANDVAGGGAMPVVTADKIVCLGDSITDGNTYPLLTAQALRAAGKIAPQFVNAGIGGDTAKGMRARLERDVLAHHPTMVLLSAGANDMARNVPLAEYEADLDAIAARLQAEKIVLVCLTVTPVAGKVTEERTPKLAEANAVVRRVAAKYGAAVAEINARMSEPPTEGLISPDGVHLEFEGYRRYTRAVLDGLGYTDVPVPATAELTVMPGIIPSWQVRPVADKEAKLDEQSIATVVPDATWTTVTLPQTKALSSWWPDQERQRGYASALHEQIGPAPHGWLAVASVTANAPRHCFLNPGGEFRTLWLNGKKVFSNDAFRGWHAGFVRLPVDLQAGANTIVMETGNTFFLSVTETDTW